MALQFEHSFVVKAPPERVWAYLTDPYRVAPALPGAAITGKIDDRSYAGTITVKVGPVSARYKGQVRFETLDPATGTAEIAASGQDVTGRGGADMKMTSRIVERPGGESEVSVVSQVNVTGIMAQFGRGLMQDVSNQMFERFTEAMRAELEGVRGAEEPVRFGPAGPPAGPGDSRRLTAGPELMTPASAPIEVSSFVLRRPAFWILVLVILAVVYWFWIR
jgi:carbon monoxide dehydrogenase subunit G